jgi:hypothetical protein
MDAKTATRTITLLNIGSCMRVALLGFFLLIGCTHTPTIPENGTYRPSLGSFECRGYPLGADVNEALGLHGGTIRVQDPIREIRFDLKEFNPALDKVTLEATRETLYESYLTQNTMPILHSVSPEAELLEARATILQEPRSLVGLRVYQSAVLLAKSGGVRGQIQYSDGRFMYTMSNFAPVEKGWSKEKQLEAAYEQLLIGLSWCHFLQIYAKPGA